MRTDRRTDVTKLIVAFRNFSKAPKKCGRCQIWFDILQPLVEFALISSVFRNTEFILLMICIFNFTFNVLFSQSIYKNLTIFVI